MTLNLFQIIALAVLGFLLVLTVVALVRRWISRREGFGWSAVWLAAAVAVAWPSLTGLVAATLGIGRGADLLLYCTVVAVLCGFMMVYVRLRHLRREMTLLVRELAIRDAQVLRPPISGFDPND